MNRIALFLPNWIGDVVMATPAIRAIREHFPTAELVAVCKPYVADVLAGAPWFRESILYDKRGPKEQRLWSVARRLRRTHTDTAVLFPNSFRAALLARLGGCRDIVGFSRYGRSLLLTQGLRPKTDFWGRPIPLPIIDDYNRLAIALGTPEPGHTMRLFATPQGEATADDVWKRFGLHRYPRVIGLNPGAAFGAAKHWPAESFANLARMIAQRSGAGVLVLCGPSEREVARKIADDARSPHVFALSDSPLSLAFSKSVVKRLDLLITTDSGPRHFAAAFERPVLTLFGPTHIEWTETYFAKAVHLQKKVACGPCQKRVCPLDHRCMHDLSPESVFAAAENLLARFPLPLADEVRHAA
jgi:heptosyltransferase II